MFIYGCIISEEEMMSLMSVDERAKYFLEHGYEKSPWDIMKDIEKTNPGFSIDFFDTAGKRAYAFGRRYDKMKEEETKKEYEESVREAVKKTFGDIPCRFFAAEEEE